MLPGWSARVEFPRVLSQLVSAGLLESEPPKGAVRLPFSTQSADVFFRRLFGAQLASD